MRSQPWTARPRMRLGDQSTFGTRNGQPNNAENIRSRILASAVSRANEMLLERGLSATGRVTPHTLRRTFVSLALIASGNDIRWVMAPVGQ